MSDLEAVKAHLRQLSEDLVPDSELMRMIKRGDFSEILGQPNAQIAHQPIRHNRVIHEDEKDRARLNSEIEKLKKERHQLLSALSEQDQMLKALKEQLRTARQRIRRSKVSHLRQDQLARLTAMFGSLVRELRRQGFIGSEIRE
jgi:septal ring factor EnvC (AmiA/AmiB activator)